MSRNRLPFWAFFAGAGLVFSVSAWGFITVPPVRSPEVREDRQVTFRLKAPKAEEVALDLAEVELGDDPVMSRDDEGVWSVTVGPLEPGIYNYRFLVDGQAWGDPANVSCAWRNAASYAQSYFQVEGDEPAFYDFRKDVPHGALRIETFFGDFAKARCTMLVYTPPGYGDSGGRRYPTLYLLHGWSGTEHSSTEVGRVHWIADNLLAEGKMKPMVIVMPFGHNAAAPYGAKDVNDEVTYRGYANYDQFLRRDVVPAVEERFRVDPKPSARALAGFSMGGAQTMRFAFTGNGDTFKHLCAMAPNGLQHWKPTEAVKASISSFDSLQVMVGRKDFLYDLNLDFIKRFGDAGVDVALVEFEGGHTYGTFRENLLHLLPTLFVDTPAD